MAGFWFLVSVVLAIVLLSRPKNNTTSNDSYAQGYWNGYRAFGDMVRDLIDKKHADEESLQSLIKYGETGGVTNNAASAPAAKVTSPESQFYADTYGDGVINDELTDIEMLDDTLEELDVTPRQYAAPAVATPARAVELSVEQKAARSLRNLNIILYTASFLLVAAGALFIASSSSAQVKLIAVLAIITVFYVAGFIVHAKSVRLRPAALAFLGTGLALIPFAGFALQEFTNLNATQSWLVTSIVGLCAYLVVAIRLQSQLVAYLTMAFVLSLAGSATAAGAPAIVWQFVSIIGVSLLATVVAHFKPGWLPKVFSEPVERSGQIVTPVALLASLVVFDSMRIIDYEIVFSVAMFHYLVAWLQTRSLTYETIVRALATAVLGLIAWDVHEGDIGVVAFVMVLALTCQHAYSLLVVTHPGRASTERSWIATLFSLQAVAFLFWLDHHLAAQFTTISLIVIGLTSVAAAIRLRQVAVGLIGLVASVIVPFVAGRDLFTPALPWWVLTSCFMVAAVVGLGFYAHWRQRSSEVRSFMTTAYITYLAFGLITAWFDGTPVVMAAAFFGAAALVLTASYLARSADSQIVVPVLVLLGMMYVADILNIASTWRLVFIGGISALVCWLLVCLHGYLQQHYRQSLMLASGQVSFLLIAGAVFGLDVQVTRVVVLLMIVAAFSSLALRWFSRTQAPQLSATFGWSYPVFYTVALFGALPLGNSWLATMAGLGSVLFVFASYLERQPWMQVIASALTVMMLGVVAVIVELPLQWFALFTFGTAAVLFYAATGLHFAYKQTDRQLIMATIAQVTLFMIIFAGVSGHYVATLTSFIILLVWAVLSLAIRWWCRDRSPSYSALFIVSYPVYYVGALLLIAPLDAIWTVVAFTVGAIIFWVSSYAERSPGIIIVGNILLAIALGNFWWWAGFSSAWMLLGIAWILAAVFYFGHWVLKGLQDVWRSQTLLWSTWIVLVGGAVFQFFVVSKTVAVAATLIAFAATLAIEGYRVKRLGMIEAAVYVVTFGLQRIAEFYLPELNVVLYAHWWAIVIALVALTRSTHKPLRLIIAMSLVTFFSGIYALTSGGNYQLLFLIEHLALLVTGAILSKNWAIWWGITASALAILYFLRTYTFLLLGFLGLLLIGIVVWRLMRGSNTTN